mgnify:CR=1 FL=1
MTAVTPTAVTTPTGRAAVFSGVEFDIDEFGPRFGAEIRGVDVASASDDQVRAIRAALVNYKVIVFRDQQLDDAAHIEFGRRLGELTFGHPVWNSGDVPAEVYSLDSADNGFADVWHTDVTFMQRPPLGSILRPVVLPRNGGDTNWADAELAYESLSEPMRRLIDGVEKYNTEAWQKFKQDYGLMGHSVTLGKLIYAGRQKLIDSGTQGRKAGR